MSVVVTIVLNGARVPVELDHAALAQIRNALDVEPVRVSPWLTVADAANYLGVTEHAMRKLIDRRQVPKHQPVPGGRIFVRRDDLDHWLEER